MFCKLRYGARPLVSLVATAGRKTPGCAQLPVMHRLMSTAEATTFEEWRKTLDEEKQKKFARIQLEVSGQRKTPDLDQLSVKDLEHLVNMSSGKRTKYYRYLFKSLKAKESMKKYANFKRSFKENNQTLELSSDAPAAEHIKYSLKDNTLFQLFRKRSLIEWQNAKLARAFFSNEPNLIFDCGFNDTMTLREQKNTAKQLHLVNNVNREAHQPFILNFCGLVKDSPFWEFLRKSMPDIDRIPLRLHTGEITTVVAPENLVYLTPDSEHVLDQFNPMDCYVIGSIVDRGIRKPVSLPKAQRLGLRTARLPLDKFFKLQGHKELTLVEMMRIMISLRQTEDWQVALDNVAKRKFQTEQEAPDDGEAE